MDLSLKAAFERLEQTRRIDLVQSGSREIVTLQVGNSHRDIDSIAAIATLKRHGVTLLKAKRTIEAVIAGQRVVLEVPRVPKTASLESELAAAGLKAKFRSKAEPNVQALREQLGLTQDQFALRFGLDIDAVRNWEHSRRAPDTAAKSLLKVIARFPDAVAEAQDG